MPIPRHTALAPLMGLIPGLLFGLLGILAPGAARADHAQCLVDLDQGHFSWSVPGQNEPVTIIVPAAAQHLASLDSLMAAGADATALRNELGAEILGPALELVAAIEDWRFIPMQVEGVPGRLGALTALNLPDGRAALMEHRISIGWPSPLHVPLRRDEMKTSGPLLLSSPFRPGIEPALDDPDTLRHALHRALRTVRLIPRNETDSSTLRRALEESRPALWWFRAGSGQLAGLQPALGALPRVVVWTLPSYEAGASPSLSPVTLASGGIGPACVLVSSRAISETRLAGLARSFCDGLARGLTCGQALVEAQRDLAADETDPIRIQAAAALVLIGDPMATVPLRRAPWLRRLWR
ncbi:hypothetical protein DRQ53_00600 [bacterium]|nr:MAG: hypothetical protein DRQ53_00600 [bacterium]